MKVWKYPINPNSLLDSQHLIRIKAKARAKPLCVMVQNGQVCLWVEVDPTAPDKDLVLQCVGTGYGAVAPGAAYLGSVIDGDYVWHFYVPKK
jgi:hypothetical protein